MDIYTVRVSRTALKALKKIPKHIVAKLRAWIEAVAHHGLDEVRKIPGYHDEPLKGKRAGQRSIRLSRGYRAIYEIDSSGAVHFVEVAEVNKHDY